MSKARRNNSEPKHGSVDYVARGLARRIGQIASAIAIAAFSVSAGASYVGFIHSGTGAVQRTLEAKARYHVAVEDFGAVGDGVTNDRNAIIGAILAHGAVQFERNKTYLVSTPIELPNGMNNISLRGKGWSTKIVGNNEYGAIRLFSHDNVRIADMWVESTVPEFGAITSFHSEITNVFIDRVKFTTNGAVLTNGIKFVMDLSTNGLDGLYVDRCVFDSPGRMAIEIQNHGAGNTIRYRNVHITHCKILRTGLAVGGGSTAGMGLSFTGLGEDCNVNYNYFDECTGPSIENIGASHSNFVGNKLRRCKARPFQFANIYPMTAVSVTGNKVYELDATAGGNPYFGSINNSSISYNNFDLRNKAGAYVELTSAGQAGTGKNDFKNNIVRVNAAQALVIDDTPDNVVTGNTLDNSLSGASTAVVVVFNAGATRNAVFNNYTRKGTGGTQYQQTGGATLNYFADFISLESGEVFVRNPAGSRNGFAIFDPGSIASLTPLTTTVTVTGAVAGDYAQASLSITGSGLMVHAEITSANLATVTYFNPTGSAIDIGSHVLRVRTNPLSS